MIEERDDSDKTEDPTLKRLDDALQRGDVARSQEVNTWVAAQHGIPVVENPPLARALHATVEIDREIAPEHYKAVPEVIGYVMRLRRGWARA
jgi:flagellar biosynthesis protein FlhB